MKRIIPVLAILALPLSAQDGQNPQTAFIQLNLDMPGQGLKSHVGDQMGSGCSLGYVFHTAPKGYATFALKLENDDFSNSSTRHEAHGVGIGAEFTFYPHAGLRGLYLSAAPTLHFWSLTDRDKGALNNQQYVRSGGSVALGYRLSPRFSVEAHWKSATLDEDLQLSSYGLGVKLHF
jgi:hypothetical protein